MVRAMRVIVVMPTYNEAENLSVVVPLLLGLPVEGLEVIVVDDNSPDGTGQLADRLAERYPGQVHVIHRDGKLGLGTAYVAGFQSALARGADYIIEMDADLSHSPSYIPQFLEAIQDCDVVVGSRYAPGARLAEEWGLSRRLLSWGGNLYTRLILGLKVQDTTGGFKCFRREVLEGIDLPRIRSDGYAFQIEMAYLCQKHGFRVREVPIRFEERARGRSKMSPKIILEAMWRVLQTRLGL
jgi:dolichol-phosphate mannosyltransferase